MVRLFFIFLTLVTRLATATSITSLIGLSDYGEELDTSIDNTCNRLVELESIDDYYRKYQKYASRNGSVGLDDTFVTYKVQAVDSFLADVSRGDARQYRDAYGYLMEQTTFGIDVILKLHQLLSGDDVHSGVYRSNNIALYLSYEKIPTAMSKLVDQVNNELVVTPNMDVWCKAAWLHYRLNRIHPFDSYNSQVMSLLVNWFALNVFNLPFPIDLYDGSSVGQKQSLALKFKDSSLLAKLYLETINWNYDTVYRSYDSKLGLFDPLSRSEEDDYGDLVMYTGLQEFQRGLTAQDFISHDNDVVLRRPGHSIPTYAGIDTNYVLPTGGCLLDVGCPPTDSPTPQPAVGKQLSQQFSDLLQINHDFSLIISGMILVLTFTNFFTFM